MTLLQVSSERAGGMMGEGRRSVLATMMALIDEHEHVVQLSHQTCDICALIGLQSASYGWTREQLQNRFQAMAVQNT